MFQKMSQRTFWSKHTRSYLPSRKGKDLFYLAQNRNESESTSNRNAFLHLNKIDVNIRGFFDYFDYLFDPKENLTPFDIHVITHENTEYK